uniref:BED-type domain-containing protein n=1 Tax=Chenopodium quinoa TaxID=63459 RepID=A0A803N0I4_CHEQI
MVTTLGTTVIVKIYLDIKEKNMLPRPLVVRTPEEKRDKRLWCEYHRECGHTTKNCRELKKALDQLADEGKLNKYLKESDRSNKEKEKARETRSDDTGGHVAVIAGGLALGGSMNKAKDNLQTLQHQKKTSNVTSLNKPGIHFKRQRKLTSDVWANFEFLDKPDEQGNIICKCKKCGQKYNAESRQGTGNLKRHIKKCKKRTFKDVGQMIIDSSSSGSMMNRVPTIDYDIVREMLSIAVVKHDLPFQFAEYSAVRKLINYINPDVKLVSRNTLKADVLKMMAARMNEKFAKYWTNFSIIMVVVVVLDPRFKYEFVEWAFKKVYGEIEGTNELVKFKERLDYLYGAYVTEASTTTPRTRRRSSRQPNEEQVDVASDSFMMDFDNFSSSKSYVPAKSDLQIYLEEPLIPPNMDPQLQDLCGKIMAMKVNDDVGDTPSPSPPQSAPESPAVMESQT